MNTISLHGGSSAKRMMKMIVTIMSCPVSLNTVRAIITRILRHHNRILYDEIIGGIEFDYSGAAREFDV